jgi:hypothetical protein
VSDKPIHRFGLWRCPACGKKLDSASSFWDDGPPSSGDVMVCFGCAEPLVFTDDHALRVATPEERAEIMADPETLFTIEAIKDDIRKR